MSHLFLLNFNPFPDFVVILSNFKSVNEHTSVSKNHVLSTKLISILLCIYSNLLIKNIEQNTEPWTYHLNSSFPIGIV